MGEYDRSSKWLIQHHGDAILRLAGVGDIVAWKPLQAELVQPEQLPDGLIEASLAGDPAPRLFVVEVATYPDKRILEQVLRDNALVYLDRRKLPEVLVLVLHPKGIQRAPDGLELESDLGWTRWIASWRVVELWTLPAGDLLATEEPGLMPWVPLCEIQGEPGPVLERCREVIEAKAAPDERANLLAVAQVLTKLRYNSPDLLTILGGRRVMIESPLIQELVAEAKAEGKAEGKAEDVLAVLRDRLPAVPDDIAAALRNIGDPARLDGLLRSALRCSDLNDFRRQLA